MNKVLAVVLAFGLVLGIFGLPVDVSATECGSASGGTFTSFPTTGLCATDGNGNTPETRNKQTTSTKFIWKCVFDYPDYYNEVSCSANRSTPPPTTYCGDDTRQSPNSSGQYEQCDNGSSNGNACTPAYGSSCSYCTSSCTNRTIIGGSCGNGVEEGSEQCDDGNLNNGDGCSNECINEGAAISIIKDDNDNSDDTQQVVNGGTATYKITVTNTGKVALKNVVITDNKSANCNRTAAQTKALYTGNTFAPGDSFSYTCTDTNVTTAHSSIVGVVGTPVNNAANVTDNDPTNVTVTGGPAISIDKNDNDNGDDTQIIESGKTATYKITVKNIGEVALKSVVVSDPTAPGCSRSASQTKGLYDGDIFAPGKSFSYTCTISGKTTTFYNTASVAGVSVTNGTSVSASDKSKVVIANTPEPKPPEEPEEEKDEKCKGSIGNTVWNDKNSNGVQDANEPGIPGVRVWLYKGNKVKKDVTNSQGRYKFKNLCSGSYRVVVKNQDIASLYQVYDPDKKLDHQTKVRLKGHDDKHTKADFGYRGAIAPQTGPGLVLSILFAALAAGGGVFYYRRRMSQNI